MMLCRVNDDAEDERDRSCAIASFRSARHALNHLRGGDGQSVKCEETSLSKNT